MSKRFKDDNGGDSPIITLTPDSAVHQNPHGNPHDSKPQARVPERAAPTPLSVEETIEVLGEMDRLNERIQRQTDKIRELNADLESKKREIAQLQEQSAKAQSIEVPPSEAAPHVIEIPSGEPQDADAKDKEIAELKDKYLRAMAEHENARRRIRQQSDDSVKRQKENLLRDLLPIVDNLERAIEAAKGKGDGKSIIEGVQMVLSSLMDLLKANGVLPMQSVGERFDPNKHEAADHIPHSGHPANTVVSEFHRGYNINDKVLRPARVVVSKREGDGKDA